MKKSDSNQPSLATARILGQAPRTLCGLIPVYNNPMTLARVVDELRSYIPHILIIDDGSNDDTGKIVDQLAAANPEHIHVKHHTKNEGKGAAMQTGLAFAEALGFDDAIQVDADCQHDLQDIPRFIQKSQRSPGAMVLGAPIFDDSIPAIRKYGRKITVLMVFLEAGTRGLPDAMCGYRLYPVKETNRLGRMNARMGYDPEVMIRAIWAGIPYEQVPTHVRYLRPEEGGVSHFRMVRDNIQNIWVHSRLLLQAPIRIALRSLRG